ncbi:hypothetical protein BASA81_002410 [Batrachochytrium salamandrivorans]|nr:hypothetical protein BASA81_002410 [Batrachochytrium salamandrivorans]
MSSSKRTRMVVEDEDEASGTAKGSWTKDEDERLLQAVAQFGTEDWSQVRQWVRSRTVKQCKDRYKLKLDPAIVTAPWTRAEDMELLRLSREHGRSWTKIAKHLTGRTENAVKARIATLERKRQCEWTEVDDQLLRDLKQRVSLGEDIAFTQFFPSRTEHSIQKRWDALNGEEIAAKVRMSLQQNQVPSLEPSQPQPLQIAKPPIAALALPQQPPINIKRHSSSMLFQPLVDFSSSPMLSRMPLTQYAANLPIPSHRGGGGKSPTPGGMVKAEDDSAAAAMMMAGDGNRLKRHSTSMTVLMQVLSGAQPPSTATPNVSSSPLPPRFPRRMTSGGMSGLPPLAHHHLPLTSSSSSLGGAGGYFVSPPSHLINKFPSTLPLTFSTTDISQLEMSPQHDLGATPGQSLFNSLLRDVAEEEEQQATTIPHLTTTTTDT